MWTETPVCRHLSGFSSHLSSRDKGQLRLDLKALSNNLWKFSLEVLRIGDPAGLSSAPHPQQEYCATGRA